MNFFQSLHARHNGTDSCVEAGWANKCLQNSIVRLLTGAERKVALAYFRRVCANDAECGHSAGDEERANFTRVFWFLVQRGAFVWVYEPDSVADSLAWRLGVYYGQCFGALCWDVQGCHVRPGCVAPCFEELPPQTAPWLRSVVGAPKGRKPKAEAKSKRGANLRGARAAGNVRDCGGSGGASCSNTIPVFADTAAGFHVVAFESEDGNVERSFAEVSDAHPAPVEEVSAGGGTVEVADASIAASQYSAPSVRSDASSASDGLGEDGLPRGLAAYLAEQGLSPMTPDAGSNASMSDDQFGENGFPLGCRSDGSRGGSPIMPDFSPDILQGCRSDGSSGGSPLKPWLSPGGTCHWSGDGSDGDAPVAAGSRRARQRRKGWVSSGPRSLQTDGHDVPADAWKRFTPEVVDASRCQARIFAGGHGGQCSQRPVSDGNLCANHSREAGRVVGLAHGYVTGEIPRAKLLEFVRRAARREEKELKVAAGEEVARRGGRPKSSVGKRWYARYRMWAEAHKLDVPVRQALHGGSRIENLSALA